MADFGGFRTIEQNSTRSRGTLPLVALQSGTWSTAAWVHPEVDGLTHFRTSLRESIIWRWLSQKAPNSISTA
jgi:hypothetical protein